ncbi:low temperature requirement protein A [Micromonospora endolithica]|nr:low temperature requirement protein A [Micromonospora endolithica]
MPRLRVAGLGDSRSPRGATVLELLFDIVYVFALARLAGRISDDLTIVRDTLLSEAGQTVVVFVAMWLVWSLNALTTSLFDPRRPDLQVILLLSMFGTLVLAVSLPQAFGERGVIFSCTYVAIQVGRPLYLTLALRGHPRQRGMLRALTWHSASGVLWIAGGASGGTGRGILWTAAVAIEVVGSATRWPVPGLGVTWQWGDRLSVDHLAERYNQFFMIALAEVLLETGAAISYPGLSTERTAALVAAFLTVVAFWRIYFSHVGPSRAATTGDARDALRPSEWASFSLLLMVTGIVCVAVGFGHVIEDPEPPIDWALVAVLFGGLVLFLVGRIFLERPVDQHRRCRVLAVGALVLVLVAPTMVLVPPIVMAVVASLIISAVAVSDRFFHASPVPTNPTL